MLDAGVFPWKKNKVKDIIQQYIIQQTKNSLHEKSTFLQVSSI